MKPVLIGFAAVATLASPALADERENAMRHIAQVMAINQLCSSVELNSTMVTLIAIGSGIDLKQDGDVLLGLAREQMVPWRGKDRDAACVAGMLLYGPNGENIPGLIDWK